jgi:acyl-CoA thioesterase I
MRLFVFGDSITQGFWDDQGGWVQRLANQYHKQSLQAMLADKDKYVEVFNLGISGDTAQGVLKRMKYEVKSRRLYPEKEIIVIAIGLNDTMIYKGVDATPSNFFHDELEQLLDAAYELTDTVVFVGLTAVDDNLCSPWKYSSSGKCYNNHRIQEFDDVIRNFCKGKDVPFIEIFKTFKQHMSQDNLLADGLHPNEKGHELIAKLVKPKLDKLLS